MKQIHHMVEVNFHSKRSCYICAENSGLRIGFLFLMLWFVDNTEGKCVCEKLVEPQGSIQTCVSLIKKNGKFKSPPLAHKQLELLKHYYRNNSGEKIPDTPPFLYFTSSLA